MASAPSQVPPPHARRFRSLAQHGTARERALIALLLGLSAALLAFGWVLPIMTVETLVLLSDRISLLDSAWQLLTSGEVFLFLVIFVFSMVFPVLKLGLAVYLWRFADIDRPGFLRSLTWIEALGKWSMLDVFVVALTVVAIQLSLVSDVAILPGIYFFTGGVVLSLLTVSHIVRLARRVLAA